jgi:putative tryptophan/tyrosine transport system substrate-binding protein
MRRREVIGLLGSATVAWPMMARAQQPAVRKIGFLSSFSNRTYVEAFREGLHDVGFIEGRNISIEFRWAERGQYDQLPTMATELVSSHVVVLFASPINAAMAAKAAKGSIPIVFVIGSDPVDMGLVASLNRPGGNATGVTYLADELAMKRLELLRELLPRIASVALLVNPNNPTTPLQTRDMRLVTTALGIQLNIVSASAESDFDIAFEGLRRQRNDALVVSADSAFMSGREKLASLAAQLSTPTIYFAREFAMAGGLISYAANLADSFRKAANYVGRILNGEKPADLPVLRPTKFELVINLKTAKALDLTIPASVLARADEVIE